MSDGLYLMRTTGPFTPKRGDLMQTAVGTNRERTWFIWFAQKWDLQRPAQKFRVLRVRWWQIEPETRIALWRSAERRPEGQLMWKQDPHRLPNPRRGIRPKRATGSGSRKS